MELFSNNVNRIQFFQTETFFDAAWNIMNIDEVNLISWCVKFVWRKI